MDGYRWISSVGFKNDGWWRLSSLLAVIFLLFIPVKEQLTVLTESGREIFTLFWRAEAMTIEEMRAVDIRNVDRESLIDIKTVEVNPELPRAERFKNFVEQIKNPYCYRCGDVVVKVGFADTDRTLEDCLEQYIRTR